ncbi:MAG: phage tail protein [Chitinivibrionales bacterium]|nr:phage tail protein [Chitinivibrionales bacterium]MBD3355694.1 phage tail protein [Chitinivibrionales bacterium]
MPEKPFTAFNFVVNLRMEGNTESLCSGEFAECDGLEMNVAPKTIREGGDNGRQIHLPAAISYGQLTLKRGMTENWDLWNWFENIYESPGLRADGEVLMRSTDRRDQVLFHLTGCMPVKLRAPSLNAKDGRIAVEEMQIAFETLYAERANG